MKVILHIGMPKSGSTALQRTFYQSRQRLSHCGVLYPEPPKRHYNHAILTVGLLPVEQWPRNLWKSCSKEDDLKQQEEAFWQGMERQVDEVEPEVVVLSAENLFRTPTPKALRAFRDRLMGIGASDIEVVVYVRRPSEYFVSDLQQRHKASYKTLQPTSPRYRRVLERYLGAFGHDSVHVQAFESGALQGADVVTDFTCRYLMRDDLDTSVLTRISRQNESISAESTDILRRYRECFHAAADNRITEDTVELFNALKEADQRVGAKRAALQPEIAELVDYSSPDPNWLAEEFGVYFSSYDYDRASRINDYAASAGSEYALHDLVVIDRSVQLSIVRSLREMPWVGQTADRTAWIETLSHSLTEPMYTCVDQ
jgi:hypothetical protein